MRGLLTFWAGLLLLLLRPVAPLAAAVHDPACASLSLALSTNDVAGARAALSLAALSSDGDAVTYLVNAPSCSAATKDEESSPLTGLLHAWNAALTGGDGASLFPPPSESLEAFEALARLLLGAGASYSARCPMGVLLTAVRHRNMRAIAAIVDAMLAQQRRPAGDGAPAAPLTACLATRDLSGSVLLHHVATSPAPGINRVLLALRRRGARAGADASALAAHAAALGLDFDLLSPWLLDDGGSSGSKADISPPSPLILLPKRALEEAAGVADAEALLPALLRLAPRDLEAALSARDARGWTPLDVACGAGRWHLMRWLHARGAAQTDCARLLSVAGFGDILNAAIAEGLLPKNASITATVQAAAPQAFQTMPSPPPLPPLPRSYDSGLHAAAGWREAACLQRRGGDCGRIPGALPVDELPLSSLAPAAREALTREYLLPGRPFVLRAAVAPNAGGGASPPLSLQQLRAAPWFEGLAVAWGDIPYATLYGQEGGNASPGRATGGSLADFVDRFMGGGVQRLTGDSPPPPLVFDSAALKGPAGILGAPFSRRRSAIYAVPPSLEQLIVGPHGSGSALHYHPPALNAALCGLKRWIFVPPGAAAYADATAKDFFNAISGSGGGRGGNRSINADIAEAPAPPAFIGPVYEVLQGPGDMVFVPALWGHAVVNLADSVAIAFEWAHATHIVERRS